MSKVCVVGLGYIGLPVASMLASRGHDVVGYDISTRAVDSINAGKSHFFEPDLDMLLEAAVQTGRLKAQTKPAEAEYFIIAVPTPLADDKEPDMSFVEKAVEQIAPFVTAGATIILESTSPVGTTEKIAESLARLRPDLKLPRYQRSDEGADLFVAHCPERILPGRMVHELVSNDRIIGGMTDACARKAEKLYKSFVAANAFLTDCRTAEFVKLIENSFRDINIAFANELSAICDEVGIDVWRAIELANRHPRVSILSPGAGVGGHCIAVDPWFVISAAPDTAKLMRAARNVNDSKPHRVAEQILHHADRFKTPAVACYGIAYKPDVEDLRESPALEIVHQLAAHPDLKILICDPFVTSLPADLEALPNVSLADAQAAREQADVVAFLVKHSAFTRMEPKLFFDKIVVDAVGLLQGVGDGKLRQATEPQSRPAGRKEETGPVAVPQKMVSGAAAA
jgi:UDP-N-acetyl-D-mannosaminuronic acid dehydrogenase